MGGCTTVQLDEGLLERVRRFVPSRGLNRFINRAVEDKVQDLGCRELEALMKEGYLATRNDREALNADWRAIDAERWPE